MKFRSFAIAFALLTLSFSVPADPCKELAESFATDIDSMSDTELGKLRTCVTNALRNRLYYNSAKELKPVPQNKNSPRPPPLPALPALW